MHGVVRRATFSRRRTLGGRSLLFGAVIALSVFVFPAMTGAQGGKATDAANKQKPSVKPEELYGDQGGAKVLPGNSRLPNAVMRAHLEDTFLKLSVPRIDEKRNALLIDYEVVSKGKFKPSALVIRADDGSNAEIALKSIAGRDSGTIQLVGTKNFGNFKFQTKVKVPENLEMYAIRREDGYEPSMTFMVSNSAVMGKMKTISKACQGTARLQER